MHQSAWMQSLNVCRSQAETIVDSAAADAFICASIKLIIYNAPDGLMYEPWDGKNYQHVRNYMVPALYADSEWMM